MKTYTYSKSIERRLLSLYFSADVYQLQTGTDWYTVAYDGAVLLSELFPAFKPYQCAGVIAALSPGSEWGRNLRDAQTFIEAYVSGARGKELPAVGTYGGLNLRKAERILNGEEPLDVLGGLKVRNFYRNIQGNSDVVTVDRHARCAALGLSRSEENAALKGDREYNWLAEHYIRASAKAGVNPRELQAVIWTVWRDNY